MVRRIVTAEDDQGNSVLVSDGTPPITRKYTHTPGFADSFIWRTNPEPELVHEAADKPMRNFIPAPGESIALTVTFPPGTVYADPSFDPVAAREEDLAMMPGFGDLFETSAPGMHKTPTVDYAVLIEGQVALELDDGVTVSLDVGDVVVQNGNRHAWRNTTSNPATIFVVLMGARE